MKVAICTPCYGDMKVPFVLSLLGLLGYTPRARPDIALNFSTVTTSVISHNRCELVKQAEAFGADYILWLDADQTFPPDALLRLLAHDLPVVGANIPQRYPPFRPTARRQDEANEAVVVWTTEELAKAKAVEPIAKMGLGVCLVKTSIFKQIPWPPFVEEVTPEHGWQGEDFHFFRLVREAGITPHVDHALSWQVGHVAERVLTHADALKAQARD